MHPRRIARYRQNPSISQQILFISATHDSVSSPLNSSIRSFGFRPSSLGMEPVRQGRARETLSKEGSNIELGNRAGRDVKDDATSKQRFYECTFCKRGFTNAQALGGHMNIHRKDRVKPSHKMKAQPSFSDGATTSGDYTVCMNRQHGAEPYRYYSIKESRRNYQKGLVASPATLIKHQVNYLRTFDFEIPSLAGLSRESRLLGPNMSLSTGRSTVEVGQVMRSDEDNKEIDLELRLGRSCS